MNTATSTQTNGLHTLTEDERAARYERGLAEGRALRDLHAGDEDTIARLVAFDTKMDDGSVFAAIFAGRAAGLSGE